MSESGASRQKYVPPRPPDTTGPGIGEDAPKGSILALILAWAALCALPFGGASSTTIAAGGMAIVALLGLVVWLLGLAQGIWDCRLDNKGGIMKNDRLRWWLYNAAFRLFGRMNFWPKLGQRLW